VEWTGRFFSESDREKWIFMKNEDFTIFIWNFFKVAKSPIS